MTFSWTNKRVLVTGSAGVIGRVMVKKLITMGADVLSLDVAPPTTLPLDVNHIEVDLSKEIPTEAVSFNPHVVFHLAATFERTVEEAGYWKTSFDNNVLASHKLLEALGTVPALEIFAFASSYLIYNPAQYMDIPNVHSLKEGDPIAPRNLVGTAKLLFEEELAFVADTEKRFRSVSSRIFRVYGRGSRDVISRWVRAAMQDEPLYIYGKTGRFDYIFADDVAEGMLRLAEADSASGVVNLGSGTSWSITDVLTILKSRFPGLKIIEQNHNYPVESNYADMTYFEQLTGWKPEFSLEEGIDEIIAFENFG